MNYEDIARLRVNEALQNGIEAQRIHRALSENGLKSVKNVVLKVPKLYDGTKSHKLYLFRIPRNMLQKLAGLIFAVKNM